MKMYHATDYANLGSILASGLRLSCDGVVYLCEKPEDCLKFAMVRGNLTPLVIECSVDKRNIVETFDHSFAFFKCKSYGSVKPIKPDKLKQFWRYDLTKLSERKEYLSKEVSI